MIVLFIFGASRIKGLSRALGEGITEFKKAMQGKPNEEEEDAIIDAAKKMGINTEGKTRKQILEEMSEKAENV